jgi:hypothetical protein
MDWSKKSNVTQPSSFELFTRKTKPTVAKDAGIMKATQATSLSKVF